MKFRVTMKDPDGVYGAVIVPAMLSLPVDASLVELHSEINARMDERREATKRWFSTKGELTVEIDTDAGTCVVCEVGK